MAAFKASILTPARAGAPAFGAAAEGAAGIPGKRKWAVPIASSWRSYV